MPIYEYRCRSCGFEKEYLQKLSDAPITDCPSCGKAEMAKLVSAAGFQLKALAVAPAVTGALTPLHSGTGLW